MRYKSYTKEMPDELRCEALWELFGILCERPYLIVKSSSWNKALRTHQDHESFAKCRDIYVYHYINYDRIDDIELIGSIDEGVRFNADFVSDSGRVYDGEIWRDIDTFFKPELTVEELLEKLDMRFPTEEEIKQSRPMSQTRSDLK